MQKHAHFNESRNLLNQYCFLPMKHFEPGNRMSDKDENSEKMRIDTLQLKPVECHLQNITAGGTMRGITLLLFIFFYSSFLWAKVILISDIDDTIKQSDVFNTTNVASGYILGKDFPAFAFSAHIYRAIIQHYQDLGQEVEVHYVTGAPASFPSDDWIKNLNFPKGEFHYKGDKPWDAVIISTLEHKIQAINKILSDGNESPKKVYMFGDSTEYDAKAYHHIYKYFEKNTQIDFHIFIRDVALNTTFTHNPGPYPEMNFYVTERDLFAMGGLSFLQDKFVETKQQIEQYLGSSGLKLLIADYQVKYLTEKIQKVHNLSDSEATTYAKKLIRQHNLQPLERARSFENLLDRTRLLYKYVPTFAREEELILATNPNPKYLQWIDNLWTNPSMSDRPPYSLESSPLSSLVRVVLSNSLLLSPQKQILLTNNLLKVELSRCHGKYLDQFLEKSRKLVEDYVFLPVAYPRTTLPEKFDRSLIAFFRFFKRNVHRKISCE